MKQDYSKFSRSERMDRTKELTPHRDEVKMGVVNTKNLNVRSSPSADSSSNIIGILMHEDKVYILPDEKSFDTEFIKIRSLTGVEGYVMKQYILRK